jgi:hypothetical protein
LGLTPGAGQLWLVRVCGLDDNGGEISSEADIVGEVDAFLAAFGKETPYLVATSGK